jgi:hypothetical protein
MFLDNFMATDPDPQGKKLNLLMKGILILTIISSTLLLPAIVSSHYFLFPHMPMYPISILRNDTSYFKIIYLANGVNYYLVLVAVFFNLSYIVCMFFNFAIIACPLLHNELRPNRASYRTLSYLREPGTLTGFYRTLEIMLKLFNQTFRPVILPAQSLMSQFNVYCNFTLITYWGEMDEAMKMILISWAVISISSWTPILQFGGWFNANAIQTVKSWKYLDWGKNDKKFLSKFRKSCRPLGIRVEGRYGQYCIRRKTVLKYIKGVTKETFTAIIALKRRS